MMFYQLAGDHAFPELGDLQLDWRYVYSRATRDEPDRRQYRYDYEDSIDDFALSDRPEGNNRVWSELADNNHDGGVAATLPFQVWNDLEAEVTTGIDARYETRSVDTRRFKLTGSERDLEVLPVPRTGPYFRELSNSACTEVIGGRQVQGNPDLERATITHLDARWEWYPDRGESVSIGAFYKDFKNPIETTYEPGATPIVPPRTSRAPATWASSSRGGPASARSPIRCGTSRSAATWRWSGRPSRSTPTRRMPSC